MSAVAWSVARAVCDPALTTNPNESPITYSSDEESDGAKVDDDVDGDSSYESSSGCMSDDDDLLSDGEDGD